MTPIWDGGGEEISFNLKLIDISGYNRNGQILTVTLADGRILTLEAYFDADGRPASRLFVSADGYLNEIELVEAVECSVPAQYGSSDVWGKWNPSGDLIFFNGTEVAVAGATEPGGTVLTEEYGLATVIDAPLVVIDTTPREFNVLEDTIDTGDVANPEE